MNKRFVSLLLVAFSAFFLIPSGSALCAQELLITILAKGSGNPIVKAEIKAGATIVYTDAKGEARIPVSDPELELRISRPGFIDTVLEPEEFADRKTLEVFLLPKLGDDDDIVIVGKKRPETSKKVINIKEAAPVAPNGDPVQVIKLLPGVQKPSGFNQGLVVRGSGPDDSIYYFDHVKLPFIFHSISNLSITPEQTIDNISFSSGGFGPEFGDAGGGVVVIDSKNSIPERPLNEIRINVPIYSGYYHERPLSEDSAFRGSIRRSTLELILPYVLKRLDADNDLTISPYFGDAYLQYLKKTDDTVYKLSLLGSMDGLKAAFPFDESESSDGRGDLDILTQFASLSFEIERRLNSAWSLSLTPYVTRQQQSINFLKNKVDIRGSEAVLHAELTHRRGTLKDYIGMVSSGGRYFIDVFVPKLVRDDPFYDREEAERLQRSVAANVYSWAGWASTEQGVGDLILTPGARVQYWSPLRKASFDPRLAGRYPLNADHLLKFAVGKYSQAPQPDQTDEVFGNPDLDFQYSIHSILGLETKWGERWTSDVQVFHKTFEEMVQSNALKNFANTGTGESYGLEIFVRRLLTERLFGWVSYTWSQNFVRLSKESDRTPSPYDQTHVTTLVSDYKLTPLWSLGGRWEYASGNRYTPVESVVYNSIFDKYQARSTKSGYNQGRMPATNMISIYADRRILDDRWQMNLRLGVEDAALGKNARNVTYNYDYSKTEYVAGPAFIPYIELKATF